MTAAIVWLILAMVLFILEGATVQLVCVWFAIGALGAMVAALLGANLVVQLIVFTVCSVGVLLLFRPLLKNRLMPKKTATNADMVIGQTGIVLVEIDNLLQTGRVSANGLEWTARSANDKIVPVHQKVLIKAIEGVKLIVEPIEEKGE